MRTQRGKEEKKKEERERGNENCTNEHKKVRKEPTKKTKNYESKLLPCCSPLGANQGRLGVGVLVSVKAQPRPATEL